MRDAYVVIIPTPWGPLPFDAIPLKKKNKQIFPHAYVIL